MILFNKKVISYQERRGKNSYTIFTDGSEHVGSLRGQVIIAICEACGANKELNFYSGLMTKPYLCQRCSKLGEKNPFFGKSHSVETKEIVSQKARQRDLSGERNPFYGKLHTEATKAIWKSNPNRRLFGADNPFFGKHHSEDTKKILSSKHRHWAANNLAFLKANGLKTAGRRVKKTMPERKVAQWLADNNIVYTYNKILPGIGQFDFFIEPNILIEVHGDYWHCNPVKYPTGPINDRQRYKIHRDIQKAQAVSKTHKLLIIWEADINNDNYLALQELQHAN